MKNRKRNTDGLKDLLLLHAAGNQHCWQAEKLNVARPTLARSTAQDAAATSFLTCTGKEF